MAYSRCYSGIYLLFARVLCIGAFDEQNGSHRAFYAFVVPLIKWRAMGLQPMYLRGIDEFPPAFVV